MNRPFEKLQEFFRTFDSNVYRVMAGGPCAPAETLMEAFEKDLDFRLPEEFRNFTLSPLGGLYIEVREDLWPRPQASSKPAWRHQFGLKIFGLSAPIPEWLDLREEIIRLPEQEGDLIPFMARTGVESRFCFDLDSQIVSWSPADQSRKPIKQSFAQLVLKELKDLEKRRMRPSKASCRDTEH